MSSSIPTEPSPNPDSNAQHMKVTESKERVSPGEHDF